MDFSSLNKSTDKPVAQIGYMNNDPANPRYLAMRTRDDDRTIWIYEGGPLPTVQRVPFPEPTENTTRFYEGDTITITF